jgi:phosphatidate cytidylyltransferase
MASHLAAQVLWVLGGVYALLVVASLVQWAMQRRRPERDLGELRSRIRSWWVMVTLFTAAMLLSPTASVVFFAFVSFLAFKEYLSIIPTRRADRRVLFWAYLTIPVQYAWVGAGQYGLFIVFIPVYAFLLLPIRMVIIGETREFLRAAGTLHWGLMATVFSISHVAYLLVLPGGNASAVAGGAGLVLYLLALTELNDVAQYVWGKSFGRHRIIPKVSPNKTWEGFVGGVATTVLLAVLLAPLLTPFTWPMAMAAGLIIGLGGFVGDVTISAVKRDLGVKDSGSVLPGHGGILDRVDSLTYTAPLFLHFTRYFYYS